MNGRFLIDNSAWARLAALPPGRREEIARAADEGSMAVCLPFLLEARDSARDAAEHSELLDELLAPPRLGIDEQVEARALHAQRQLAQAGHHRLPPVDLLLAGLADRHRVALVHYDAHYDLIVARTDLRFESVWVAPRGTL